MKKISFYSRAVLPLICCSSLLLISGCSTLSEALSKPKVNASTPAHVIVEKVDVAASNNKNNTRHPVSNTTAEATLSESAPNVVNSNTVNTVTSEAQPLPDGVVSWESLRGSNSQETLVDSGNTDNTSVNANVNNQNADSVYSPFVQNDVISNQPTSLDEFGQIIIATDIAENSLGIPTLPTEGSVESVDAPFIAQDELSNGSINHARYDIWSRIRQGYAIPHVEHALINRYIAWNQTHSDYVSGMLARSRPYLHYIVEQIEARGMPMEIALLPAIESAYKARAYSRSSASGLWQFIPSTGHHFGMRQDWWSDQRRDVITATNKALDYLLDLNQEFNGDWMLAMASYNGGRGTIARAIRKNQRAGLNTDYFSLSLRRETAHYVAKILALSKVIMNPEQFGIQLPNIPNQAYFEKVDLKGQTDLVALISNTSITRKEFDKLNPQFLRWASDPLGPHRIIVPIEHSLSTNNYIDSLGAEHTIRWRKHQLNIGDTLSGLASRYGVSTSSIRSINGMRSSRLRAGKTILIPVRDNNSSLPQAVQKPSSANNLNNSNSNIVTNNPSNTNNALSDIPQTHTVQSGDTLWNIARSYNVSIDQLLSLNNLQYGGTLSLNQTLRLRAL